jgi:predicted O-methyltransferase YrrM
VDAYPDWSLPPEALASVSAEIAARGSRAVVELGCGASTLTIAAALPPGNGSLTSVEHDLEWARSVRARLGEEGLAGVAEVVHAPLAAHPLGLDGARWYSLAALERLPAAIDFLLVDGPPGNEPGIELSRYPALPALAPRLAAGAAVALDDAARPGEREILRRWQAEHPISFEPAAGGRLAIGTFGGDGGG